jgi:signal transduction histidine kinase
MTTRVRDLLPRRTVRLRLTLLYGGLFLLSGAALLTVTYLLVRHSTGNIFVISDRRFAPPSASPTPFRSIGPTPDLSGIPGVSHAQDRARQQHAAELHQLLLQSGIALAIMTVVSVVLGWLVAGRVLVPLRTMTATTRRISHENLHQRLGLQGPQDELKELGDTIDGLLVRLETAFHAQRRFAANASHELRTPLAMMRTSVDVATGKPVPVPAEVTRLADKVREGLDQADRLLESLLTLSRAEHGALSDEATVSLAGLADAAIDARADAIAGKAIDVERELVPACARGSRTLLMRLVENLVDNAVRHNVSPGWLRVSTGVHGSRARLVVESGGRLLDDEEVRQLGQPFQRLGAARVGSEHGVGLGLSIVAAVASVHDGSLRLRARPEGGLLAVVELPRAVTGHEVTAPR